MELLILSSCNRTGYTITEIYEADVFNDFLINACKWDYSKANPDEAIYLERGTAKVMKVEKILTLDGVHKTKEIFKEYVSFLNDKKEEERNEYERLKSKYESVTFEKLKEKIHFHPNMHDLNGDVTEDEIKSFFELEGKTIEEEATYFVSDEYDVVEKAMKEVQNKFNWGMSTAKGMIFSIILGPNVSTFTVVFSNCVMFPNLNENANVIGTSYISEDESLTNQVKVYAVLFGVEDIKIGKEMNT